MAGAPGAGAGAGDVKQGAGAGDVKQGAAALLTPALVLYYLCCWPGDAKSETSSEKSSRGRSRSRSKPSPSVPGEESGTAARARRASGLQLHKRIATSVLSLHLPTTSGHKKEALSAHRSHEEIRRHGRRGADTCTSRYHSAPSVIDEVVHRRDWERSTRDLHIPLRSPAGSGSASDGSSHSEHSPSSTRARARACADPHSPSVEEDQQTDEQIVRSCKKHYTNIKSSKRKEKEIEDKDRDATELPECSTFYIGDNDRDLHRDRRLDLDPDLDRDLDRDSDRDLNCDLNRDLNLCNSPVNIKLFKAKEAKQSFNESIRRSDRPRPAVGAGGGGGALAPLDERALALGFSLDDVIDRLDRSGATHHTIESRVSLSQPPHPPPSVDAVGYEGGACYLASPSRAGAPVTLPGAGAGVTSARASRARHASDGDILAAARAARPESGAFSESDLEVEVDPAEEVPPPYEELQLFASPKKKETAI